MAAPFQDIAESDEIGVHIRGRVLQRVPHTRLRSQMNDQLRLHVREELRDSGAVRQIHRNKLEPLVGRQLIDPCLLQARVVVVVQVIEPDHFVAAFEQQFADEHADESGRAGDEDPAHEAGARSAIPSLYTAPTALRTSPSSGSETGGCARPSPIP